MSASTILHSTYRGLAAWLTAAGGDGSASAPLAGGAATGPAPMAEDGAEVGSSGLIAGSSAETDARAAARERIMTKLMDELIFHSRTEVIICPARVLEKGRVWSANPLHVMRTLHHAGCGRCEHQKFVDCSRLIDMMNPLLQVRCGGCVALLSLVSYTGRNAALRSRLPAIQVRS